MGSEGVTGALISGGAAFFGATIAIMVQQLSARRTARQATRDAKYQVLREFVLAYRALRRHLMNPDVVVQTRAEPEGKQHVVIRPLAGQWERVDAAWADLRLLGPTPAILSAAEELRLQWYALAHARADHAPGSIPTPIIRAVGAAELHLIAEIRKLDLRSDWTL